MDENTQTHEEHLRSLFLETALTRLFIIAAAPGAVSMLASAVFDLVDGIIVGRFLGPTSFAAINIAMPFVILVFAVGDLMGVGSSVPIAIALGAGKKEEANNIFTCTVLGIFLLGALLGAGFWVFAPAIMTAMGATGTLADQGVTFLRVYALAAPLSSMMFAVDNFLRNCGRIRESLLLNLLMATLGGVLEFILVGHVKLGVAGAALGYSFAMSACALIGLAPFALGRYQLRFVRPRPTAALTREVFTAGMPTFLNNVAGRATMVLLEHALLRLGGADAVAVYGVLIYSACLVFPLIMGTCDALQPAIGYNLGAGHTDRVVKLEKRVLAACAAASISFVPLTTIFSKEITLLFMPDASQNLIEMALRAFPLYSAAYLIRWIPLCTQAFFTALKRPKPASTLSLFNVLIAPVICLVALLPLGLDGVWLNTVASTFASSILAIVMLLRLRSELRAS